MVMWESDGFKIPLSSSGIHCLSIPLMTMAAIRVRRLVKARRWYFVVVHSKFPVRRLARTSCANLKIPVRRLARLRCAILKILVSQLDISETRARSSPLCLKVVVLIDSGGEK